MEKKIAKAIQMCREGEKECKARGKAAVKSLTRLMYEVQGETYRQIRKALEEHGAGGRHVVAALRDRLEDDALRLSPWDPIEREFSIYDRLFVVRRVAEVLGLER